MSNLLQERWLRLAFAKDSTTVIVEKKHDPYEKCWDGYERVPGKKRDEKGSCRKKEGSDPMGDEGNNLWDNIRAKDKRIKAGSGEKKAKPGDDDYPATLDVNENDELAEIKRAVESVLLQEKGLWDNIRAKRKRGEPPAKPGEEGYPSEKAWKETTAEGEDVEEGHMMTETDETDENIAYAIASEVVEDPDADEVEVDGKKFPVKMSKAKAEKITGKKIEETLRMYIRQELLREFDKDKMACNKPRYLKKGESGYGKKQKVVKACDNGKEKIVKFGDANMKNKSNNKDSKANFRARHNCSDKKDKMKAGYWACKDW